MAGKVGEALTRLGMVAAAWTAGVLIMEHAVVPAVFGDPSLEDNLATRIDRVAVGQPFNQDDPKHPSNGLRLESIHSPNASGIRTAWYNAYENSGAQDPTKPSTRLQAAVACSTFILNGGQLPKDVVDEWSTAQRNNVQSGDEKLSDQEFGKAAESCAVSVDALLTGPHPHADIVVPVANG